MADIGDALAQYLATKPTVVGLVGSRIGPDAIDQSTTLPAVAYFVIDSVSEEHLRGAAGFATTRIQIDCYATTRKGANALQEAIRLALPQGYRGLMADVPVSNVSRGGGVRDTTDSPVDGSNVRRYLRSADYIISHQE